MELSILRLTATTGANYKRVEEILGTVLMNSLESWLKTGVLSKTINISSLTIIMHWMSRRLINCCQPSNMGNMGNVKFIFMYLAVKRGSKVNSTLE